MRYRNILLIDDDEDDQLIFKTVLSSITDTIQCVALNDGELAIQRMQAKTLVPDLIFLDLNLPKMDGQQFLAALKGEDQLKEIPVIVLTTSSNPDSIQKVKTLGAIDFFVKPSRYSDLKKILEDILC
jgi:CheY-like chemotaxis protein